MADDRWPRMRAILESALEKPVAERADYVRAACAGDDGMKAGVLSLISAHGEGEYLESFELSAADPWTGRQLGAWMLGPRIGEGGMGAVYEASRADGQYEQRAAVKLVRAALNSEDARRFRNERQMLARLEHPNIARLLDGGVTDLGTPYLVLEYVEGVPIDAYCARRNAGVDEILTLFRAVCSAVEHAHRNLIVHRDIKPANILVTNDGVPKLLDFGIAKLLDSPGADLTRTSQRPMTPAYASPEQVLGEEVTTATDVYSLGVLLYRLLTGCAPYRLPRGERDELERAILEQEPTLPSVAAQGPRFLRNQLRGDLDAIVLTAMAKEPARRYASVGRLADDIANYQSGLPVSARADSGLNRAIKFTKRHRAPVSVAAAAAIALTAATAISVQSARRADARFQDTRRLANFFLFEFDDAIRAGATAARKSVVEKGLEYLNRLSAESGGDLGLRREVLAGYSKIGELQGNIFDSNVGDVAGARASYLKALEVGRAIQATDPNGKKTRRDLAVVYQHLGEIEATAGNCKQALQWTLQALALLDPPDGPGPENEDLDAALQVHSRIAWIAYRLADYGRALSQYERYGELARRFYGERPLPAAQRRALVYEEERKGETLARMGRVDEGLGLLRGALEGYRALAKETPGADAERDVIAVASILGDLLHQAGRDRESLTYLRDAETKLEALIRGDPRNLEYRRDLAEDFTVLAEVLNRLGQPGEARTVTGRAFRLMREIPGQAMQWDLYQYARLLLTTPFREFRNDAEALQTSERALKMTDGTDPQVVDLFAQALFACGQRERALDVERQAMALIPAGNSDVRTRIGGNLTRMLGDATKRPSPPAPGR